MRVAHQATFQSSVTFQGIGYTERGEGNVVAAMLMILGVGWSPLLGVILQDLSLSPLKAIVTSAGILSHKGG